MPRSTFPNRRESTYRTRFAVQTNGASSRPRQAADHQPAVVAIDPTIAFGRPMLAQSGVKTEVIASRFNAGDEPADMAIDYGVSVQDILEALRYERRQAQAA